MPLLIWLRRSFTSSLGKKLLMAVTGLLLGGFLVAHLTGNLLIYADESGEAFDHYARLLEDNPLLPVVEIGLAALFLAHIALGIRVTKENREARGQGYRQRNTHGARTAGSATMVFTGLIVLIFLLVHVYDFRLSKAAPEGLATMVKVRLGGVAGFLIYVVGVAALVLHLSHGFSSALQTLGVNHPRYQVLLRRAGLALAIVLGLGFLSFPVVYFFGGFA